MVMLLSGRVTKLVQKLLLQQAAVSLQAILLLLHLKLQKSCRVDCLKIMVSICRWKMKLPHYLRLLVRLGEEGYL